MALVADRSKAVVLLLLFHCILMLSLTVGVLCLVLAFVIRYLVFFLAFVGLLCFFSVLYLLCLRAPLFICALWSTAGKGLPFWHSFVVSNCEFVTFPLVSCVRCGT